MRAKLLCAAVATSILFAEAVAQGARYEIFPEPSVRQAERNRVNSAYVVDKKESQFWICTARYEYLSGERNQGECVRLPAEIGRPSLTENYTTKAVVGSTPYGPFLPVMWFIDPTSGDIQFCALRHAGICLQMTPK
jgi:hypothetical protein